MDYRHRAVRESDRAAFWDEFEEREPECYQAYEREGCQRACDCSNT